MVISVHVFKGCVDFNLFNRVLTVNDGVYGTSLLFKTCLRSPVMRGSVSGREQEVHL